MLKNESEVIIWESILERNRQLPKYHKTMYLEGYTPDEM